MRNPFALALLGFVILGFSFQTASVAQEEESAYSWGAVSSVSAEQIILLEDDYETNEKVSVTYILDPNVELHNIKSLEEITVAGEVWVDYVLKEGQKIAIGIEPKGASEESVPLEIYEEPDYSEEGIE